MIVLTYGYAAQFETELLLGVTTVWLIQPLFYKILKKCRHIRIES